MVRRTDFFIIFYFHAIASWMVCKKGNPEMYNSDVSNQLTLLSYRLFSCPR